MSAEDRCYFCQRLPALPGHRRRAGTATRCPVCKGWLVQTSAQTYRDDGDPSAGQGRPGPRLVLAACGVGGFVTLAAVGGLLALVALRTPAPLAQREGPPSTRAVAVTLPPLSFSDQVRPPEMPPAPRKTQPAVPAPERTVTFRPKSPAEHPASPPAPATAKPVAVVRPKPAVPPPEPDRRQAAPGAQARETLPPWEDTDSPEALAKLFRHVPELSLTDFPEPGSGGAGNSTQRKAAWQRLEQTVQKRREHFLDGLLAKRPDLTGLPFGKGKDCRLERATAQELDKSSRKVRFLLAASLDRTGRRRVQDPEDLGSPASMALRVYEGLIRDRSLRDPAAAPALEQILTGDLVPARVALVQYLSAPSDSSAAPAVLARRAVFDPSAEVRQTAVLGLRDRPAAAYVPILLGGLRHPWSPANYNAAAALTALGADGAVPDLLRVLDAPDPRSPFEVLKGGKHVWAVRELVRVNHHGSCLLCHAPSFDKSDLVRAPVPSPLEPLPPPLEYYEPRRTSAGRLFARADVTYLRQDFSEVLPVENSKPWPRLQRFDFLVRVRPLMEGEVQAWRGREQLAGPQPLPASQQAAVFALRQLTGLDGGYTAASWRRTLAHAGPRGPVSPGSADVRGR